MRGYEEMEDISVVLSGIGGYGNNYVRALLDEAKNRGVHIEGVVDPFPESCRYLNELRAQGIPIYATLETFYKERSADLTIISSPIQFHCEQTCFALSYGSNVLCEKPAAATVDEVYDMMGVRDKADKLLAIGFQWAYDPVYQQLKRDIMSGLLGRPKRLKTLVLWPRDTAYYKRGWAGKIRDENGRWVLDSVANNATAHFLHNMLFALGEQLCSSIEPAEITAELYKANDIENFDTAAMRVYTENEAEILFYASHAVKENVEPMFCYEFGNGTVYYNNPSVVDSNEHIVAVFTDGRIKDYGKPQHQGMYKLWSTIDAVRGKTSVICPPEAALPHTLCINGAQLSMRDITIFPDEWIIKEGEPTLIHVKGLEDALMGCFDDNELPSEKKLPWARSGKPISLKNFRHFEWL